MTRLSLADLSVVFISYDEPRGDHNWRDLLAKCPWAQRVHGVTGFDEAHKAAARLSDTEHFITVDGDTLVEPWLFEATIPFLGHDVLVAWRARNAINGLVYGNGSVKCWPRRLALEMQTHERSSEGNSAVDFGLGPTRRRFFLDEIPATTYPNGTPFQAFRAGFREGVRGCLVDGHPAKQLQRDLDPWQFLYLRAWCSIGADATNGLWALLGARSGCIFTAIEAGDPRLINDYDRFLEYWDESIAPQFRGDDIQCRLTGYMWSRSLLEAAVESTGEQLRTELDVPVVDLTAEQSGRMKRAFVATPAETKSRYDLRGNLHQRVGAGAAGIEEAAHCYRMAAALGSTNAMNNLARLNLAGDRVDLGDVLELLLNATALGNAFAPSALAALLGDGKLLRAEPQQARYYAELATERGRPLDRDSEDEVRGLETEAAADEPPALDSVVLALKDLQVVFLGGDSGGSQDRWHELMRNCPFATRMAPRDGGSLPRSDAPDTGHVMVIRDDCIVDLRFFDFVIDRSRLTDTHVIAWPARDAITQLLTYESGPQCWPRALFEQHGQAVPGVTADDSQTFRLASECLAVQASNVSPRQAFGSGFSAARHLLQVLAQDQSPEKRRRPAMELVLWCSLGADCDFGLWSIYGARLACVADAACGDADHYWREAERGAIAEDLSTAVLTVGGTVRQKRGLEIMDLSPAASALFKEIAYQPFSSECFEQLASQAASRGDGTGEVRAAQLHRVAAGLGSTSALAELANHYRQGRGVTRDERRGRYLLSIAEAALAR